MAMIRRLTTNRALGLVLALLAFIGIFLGSPYRGATATIDSAELARIVEREVDHVAPKELADWIIQGKADFRLLDLRPGEAYAAYHIPGAENVPMTSLAEYGLARNEKIVVYSEGGIHSAQAWFLLKAREYDGVYILRGGLEEWKETVLYPALPVEATPAQRVEFARMKEVSAFFGGMPRTGTMAATPSIDTAPPPPPPATGAPASGTPQKKKKKEGC